MMPENIYELEAETQDLQSVDLQKAAELVARMEAKEEHLSFSSIANFAKSPRHFMIYKLGEFKETPAMLLGSLIDCLITEPDNFDSKYTVPPANAAMNSNEGLQSWADFLGIEFEATWKMIDKKRAIDSEKEQSGLKFVDAKTKEQAERIAREVIKNDAANYVLSRVTETQKSLSWEYGGWNWKGKPDFVGGGMIADLKLTADALPRKCERVILDDRYHWQQALYGQGKDQDHFVVMVDRAGNVSVHQLSRKTILNAWSQIDDCITKLERCILWGDWWKSYDFHTPHGIYKI